MKITLTIEIEDGKVSVSSPSQLPAATFVPPSTQDVREHLGAPPPPPPVLPNADPEVVREQAVNGSKLTDRTYEPSIFGGDPTKPGGISDGI